MQTRFFLQGCKAGLLAGIAWGILLVMFCSPLIAEAEKYEIVAPHVHAAEGDHGGAAVEEPEEEHSPEGIWRPVLTVVGAAVLGTSYGVVLTLLALLGHTLGAFDLRASRWPWAALAVLGLCAYSSIHLIPSLGLGTPLPGIVGAEGDLAPRQSWWTFAAACSFAGFALAGFALTKRFGQISSAFGPIKIMRPLGLAVGVLLVALPFLKGVPVHATTSTVPAMLRHKFEWVSLATNAAFWVVLVAAFSVFCTRLDERTAAR